MTITTSSTSVDAPFERPAVTPREISQAESQELLAVLAPAPVKSSRFTVFGISKFSKVWGFPILGSIALSLVVINIYVTSL